MNYWLSGGALAAALLLAGCGGADTDTSPTPMPTPTPTPTPTQSYTKFEALVGDQRYASACSVDELLIADGTPSLAGSATFGRDGGIFLSDTRKEYQISLPNVFGAIAIPLSGRTSATANLVSYETDIDARTRAYLTLERPLSLDYARRIHFRTLFSNNGHQDSRLNAYCILGVPTRTDDVPKAPLVRFTQFAIDGIIYDRRTSAIAQQYLVESGVATLSVDLSTGIIRTELTLEGRSTSGAITHVGPYQFSAGIDVNTAGFFGGLATVPNSEIGMLGGGFFGPQGAEFGYVFDYRHIDGTGSYDLVFKGTVVGRR